MGTESKSRTRAPAATRYSNAKGKDRPYKLFDGSGLYLLVNPNDARYWRLKYRFAGEEKSLALGVFPEVTVAEARERRDDARRLLRDAKDPAEAKQQRKREQKQAAGTTFGGIAEEWLGKKRATWEPANADRVARSFEININPYLGKLPISAIKPPTILAMLKKIDARGAHETRAKAQRYTSAVFRYAVANGFCESDPTRDIRGAFITRKVKHHAALEERELPEFLAKVDAYDGEPVTKLALRLLVLTWARTAEIRHAEWSEIDFAKAEWRVPGSRMKKEDLHIVPLARQTVALLKELHALTGEGRYLFPHDRKPEQTMSANTMLFALYRMGYHGRATVHGFRATATTIFDELEYKAEAVERQLSHKERGKSRAAYHRSPYLDARRKMLQKWADMIDGYKKPKVIVGKFGSKR